MSSPTYFLLLEKIDELGEGSLASPLRKILYALEFEIRALRERVQELERSREDHIEMIRTLRRRIDRMVR